MSLENTQLPPKDSRPILNPPIPAHKSANVNDETINQS